MIWHRFYRRFQRHASFVWLYSEVCGEIKFGFILTIFSWGVFYCSCQYFTWTFQFCLRVSLLLLNFLASAIDFVVHDLFSSDFISSSQVWHSLVVLYSNTLSGFLSSAVWEVCQGPTSHGGCDIFASKSWLYENVTSQKSFLPKFLFFQKFEFSFRFTTLTTTLKLIFKLQ